jgi:hypothetical protein
MMAGHEMRRVREMYPSFDTRRVLCKQQRNHRVKPMRASLKAKNASNAGSILSGQKTGEENCGRLKSIVVSTVLTKTQHEGQSIAAWNAMSPLGWALRLRQGFLAEQAQAQLANGERSTDLKPNQRHRLDGYRWKKRLNERRKRLFCGSKRHGLTQQGWFAGLAARLLVASSPCKNITSSMKQIRGAAPNTHAKDITRAKSQECLR